MTIVVCDICGGRGSQGDEPQWMENAAALNTIRPPAYGIAFAHACSACATACGMACFKALTQIVQLRSQVAAIKKP